MTFFTRLLNFRRIKAGSHSHALILALQISFSVCFFLGIFYNGGPRLQEINQDHWYYVNRGYPIAWAGVSRTNYPVDLPLIKAPLIFIKARNDWYNKVIDLSIFLPLFAAVFLITLPIAALYAKVARENKAFDLIIFRPGTLFLWFLCAFLYFFWFPRI